MYGISKKFIGYTLWTLAQTVPLKPCQENMDNVGSEYFISLRSPMFPVCQTVEQNGPMPTELYHYKIISLASYSPPPLVNNPPKKTHSSPGSLQSTSQLKRRWWRSKNKKKKKKKKDLVGKQTPTQRDFLLSRIRWQPAATLAPSEIPLLDSLSPRVALSSQASIQLCIPF